MIEKEMGYLRSKSINFNKKKKSVIVKEQWVDSSQCINTTKIHLRNTLMGFEINYQIKILSNQIFKIRQFCSSAVSNQPIINSQSAPLKPLFITGFVDAEGSFTVSVLKSSSTLIGRQVAARFKITTHIKDLPLLRDFQTYFGGVGRIVIYKDTCTFRVDSLKQISNVIIPHFNKYPPITQKLGDYLLFRDIIKMMNNREHLTLQGLERILSIKASLNLGLSDELKAAFPKIEPILRPLVVNQKITHPDWIAGFTSGDGSFYITIRKYNGYKLGYRIEIGFRITQHSRDAQLMESFIDYFNCGKVRKDGRNSVLYFTVSNLTDNLEKIIPFFQKHRIIGVKYKDFEDWCKAAEIIRTGAHLSMEGLDELRKIKGKMNSSR